MQIYFEKKTRPVGSTDLLFKAYNDMQAQ